MGRGWVGNLFEGKSSVRMDDLRGSWYLSFHSYGKVVESDC